MKRACDLLPVSALVALATSVMGVAFSQGLAVEGESEIRPDTEALAKRHGPFRTDASRGIRKRIRAREVDIEAIDRKREEAARADAVGATVPDSLLVKFKKSAPAPLPAPGIRQAPVKSGEAVVSGILGAKRIRTVRSVIRPLEVVGGRLKKKGDEPDPREQRRAAQRVEVVKKARERGLDRWHRVELKGGTDRDEAQRLLKTDPRIEFVEREVIFWASGLPDSTTDPKYSEQWHLEDARVPEAWAHLESLGLPPGGSRDVVVAVIDTGVDYTHEDLAANMWVNQREIPGNGTDDDGNGYVDDVHGIDATTTSQGRRGNPQDDHGHGTHVAGIIAAQGGNGIGGAGVAYLSQIMAIKSAQYSGVLTSTAIAEGIYYAVENGADVINMSFGGSLESVIVKDALAVAFGQAVLVASAGNEGLPNDPQCDELGRYWINYPAAYPWVLGVMAHQGFPNPSSGNWRAGFSNWECIPEDHIEYELMAPGVRIVSTLPHDTYSSWSGTSMAAPVVSGVAALLRTRWPDKASHSSRFLMGQLASTGASRPRHPALDAIAALTQTPNPDLAFLEHWVFDTPDIAEGNDDDGILDAGETIELGIVIKNHWGRADEVSIKLEAMAVGAVGLDPYITIPVDTVDYGSIGSFSQKENEFIRDAEGVITGVGLPFRVEVAPDIPNDHIIPFKLTMTARNGLDPGDPAIYESTARFYLVAQNGRQLPSIIEEDMVLDKNSFWIIDRPVLVREGVTLTITEGAQVQFYSSDPQKVYDGNNPLPFVQVEGSLRIEGTNSRPVQLFVSDLYRGQYITVFGDGGEIVMNYAHVADPKIGNHPFRGPSAGKASQFTSISHVLFYRTFKPSGYDLKPYIFADEIFRSQFYGMAPGHPDRFTSGLWTGGSSIEESLFDVCNFSSGDGYDVHKARASVFLKNNAYWKDPFDSPSILESFGADGLSRNNAFLNVWSDPNPGHWLRFFAPDGRDSVRDLSGNYWGTSSRTLIDAAIWDFSDDFNLGTIVYEPILENPAEETYPFVVDVQFDTASGQDVEEIGAEEVSFVVTFNRDMDSNVQPQVSFGPAEPWTDFRVQPDGGGWVDARTWRGAARVTPLTGDGWQYVRVVGAAAADDPWLVTGHDSERFRFMVNTSDAQALNMTVTGGEGYIDVSWVQDDFELLAGYNVYRGESPVGEFVRLNDTVLPREQTTIRDEAVEPGQPYYYYFTVVQTDFSESEPSNTSSGTPYDTIPPVISHEPLTNASPRLPLSLLADVTDNVAVSTVKLYFRAIGESDYVERAMVRTTGNRYAATLEGSEVRSPGTEYYLEASDGPNITRSGRADAPHRIQVVDRPVITAISPGNGPATGGTTVTIAGSNFKSGAAVHFGEMGGLAVEVLSESQITCTTPPHFATSVDVSVTNPDGGQGVLLSGFSYSADSVGVLIPALTGGRGQKVDVPVLLSGAEGLAAVDLNLSYDSAVLEIEEVRLGGLAVNWTLAANTTVAGELRVSMASSAGTLSGSGEFIIMEFRVNGAPSSSTILDLEEVFLNDGSLGATVQDGSFTVDATYALSGRVRYWKDQQAVEAVTLSLLGERNQEAISGADGSYSLGNIDGGAYALEAAKSGDENGISAYDASLILQHAAALATLSGSSAVAADVNRNGRINAMDAFYVLEHSVELRGLPFPGSGASWVFAPARREYAPLAANQTGQDFTAILLGDVSGNWSTGGVQNVDDSGARLVLHITEVPNSDQLVMRVLLDNGDPVIQSFEFDLLYDIQLELQDVTAGPMISGFSHVENTTVPGRLRVAIAGARSLEGSDVLLTLSFRDAGAANKPRLAGYSINENAYSLEVSDSIAAFDSDDDGIIDVNESEIFHTDPTNPDTNGDGVVDGRAVDLGLDPADPNSRFVFRERTKTSTGMQLSWPSKSGNAYQLECSSDLEHWEPLGAPIIADGPETSVEAPLFPEPRKFYRVRFISD